MHVRDECLKHFLIWKFFWNFPEKFFPEPYTVRGEMVCMGATGQEDPFGGPDPQPDRVRSPSCLLYTSDAADE